MLRILILIVLFFSIKSHAQTNYYLKDATSPNSIEDITRLLNLKNAKIISIFSQEKDTIIFEGEIHLYKNGKCSKKQSIRDRITKHVYNSKGKIIEDVSFSLPDTSYFKHEQYTYNDSGGLIAEITKDKYGNIIQIDSNSILLSLEIGFPPVNPKPRYKSYRVENDTLGKEKYTYDYNGQLIRYFTEGFYLPSAKSRDDENSNENSLEYRFEYNQDGQITKFYKKLKTTTSLCEVNTAFNYINKNIIHVKSDKIGCGCISCSQTIVLKVEYY